jgi:hypothetical protein
MVQFTSDSSGTGDGFSLQYTALYCLNSTVADSSGTLRDGSGIYPYLPGVTCKWLLNPDGNYQYMQLNFLDLLTSTATLSFYSGTDESGKLLLQIAPG